MTDEINILKPLLSFVSGEMHPKEFHSILVENKEFKKFLENDPHLKPANYVNGSTYEFLIDCDFNDPGGILDAVGAVSDYLDRNSYEYNQTDRYIDFFNIMLEASPDWISPDPKYVMDHIMPEANGRKGSQLNKWIKEQLLQSYQYVSKPPEWIQDPIWPHGDKGPFVFLGQFDVKDYFHDFATVYVFHDPATDECKTFIQCF